MLTLSEMCKAPVDANIYIEREGEGEREVTIAVPFMLTRKMVIFLALIRFFTFIFCSDLWKPLKREVILIFYLLRHLKTCRLLEFAMHKFIYLPIRFK